MGMYESILLLMDCSPVDEAIVRHVALLARFHGSRVHLFHVVHAHTLDQERVMAAEVEGCFAKARAVLEEQNIEVSQTAVEGEPEQKVLEEVQKGGWDLIAMATHGHRGFSDFILGSISEKLKHSTDKPLLLLKGQR